jgi:hypothetical protein
MSKYLLNLLLQISKALVYSKIKFLFGKEFFLHFRPIRSFGPAMAHSLFLFFSTSRPPCPPPPLLSPLGLGLSAGLAHPHGPTDHLLPPPAPKPSAQAAAADRPRTAPRSTPMTSTGRKIMAASLLLHSPIKRRHFPSSILGNRRLQSGGIEASSTPAIEGTQPPPPRLRPIKGRPALGEDSHTYNAPPPSPQRATTAALLSRASAVGETPLHHLTNRGNPVIELACPSFPSPTPWSELSGTGAVGGRAPVSSRARQWLLVHGGPGQHGP